MYVPPSGKTPAPNAYDLQSSGLNLSGGIKIKNKYEPLKPFNTPGVGSYQPSDTFVSSQPPSFTIQKKYNYKLDNGSPGPQAYNPNIIKSQCNASMSSRYKLYYDNNKPGPNKYDIGKDFGAESPYVTMSGRRAPDKYNQNPGPGAYEIGQKFETKGASIANIYRAKSSDQVPGPGSYNTDFSAFKSSGNKGAQFAGRMSLTQGFFRK
ncbi:SHIPPO 1-like protein [Spironucleus salmonicida]|uniref:SHIPPO 1-like protein n=1 Tax=Spironucleus salmonicida TaxID=348837 RepID=V6LJ54_9EUKA|nr:SHIPPO 1-like protein [Spironucleus salmonicida]|eukprot:EST44602.1 SHIPPO 1-like protein [Spironucleus salmonicida]